MNTIHIPIAAIALFQAILLLITSGCSTSSPSKTAQSEAPVLGPEPPLLATYEPEEPERISELAVIRYNPSGHEIDRTKLDSSQAVRRTVLALRSRSRDTWQEAIELNKVIKPNDLHPEDASRLAMLQIKLGFMAGDDAALERALEIYDAARPGLKSVTFAEESTWLRLASYRLGKTPPPNTRPTNATIEIGLENVRRQATEPIQLTVNYGADPDVAKEAEKRAQAIIFDYIRNWVKHGQANPKDIQNLGVLLRLQGVSLSPFNNPAVVDGNTLSTHVIDQLNHK